MQAEYQRKLHNLATIGTVFDIDADKQLMRLKVGDNETDWLTIPTLAAGQLRVWRCPTKGEQFLLLCPSGELENAVAVIALYSDKNPTPSTNKDEIRLRFNDEDFLSVLVVDSKLELTISEVVLNAKTSVAINTPKATINAEETTITGNLQVNGNIHSDGDTVAGSVSLKSHTHSGVDSGPSNTGVPNP